MKSKKIKSFKEPYVAFAEDYLHTGHYKGLAASIEQIKKAATIRKAARNETK